MRKNTTAFLFLFFIGITLIAQEKYPQNYFRNPLEIPIVLAGTFGELRTAHFHSGMDLKTQRKEGLNIHTAAEGYVSRIKISLWGYGKALYITHPNGYTTVYAHLKKFNEKIEAYIREKQYKKESFEIQVFPRKEELKIEKDEIIAFSGSTGGFIAPHLHFEIRNTKTEKIINPMHFGLKPADTKKPQIKHLRAYALNDSSHVNRSNIPLPLTLKKISEGTFSTDEISAYGKIGFSVNTFDRQNAAPNKNGVYKIEMFLNDKKVYKHTLETFSFKESKLINLLIDYPYYALHKRRYQKTHVHPESNLSIYNNVFEKGEITIKNNSNDTVTIKVSDFHGNTSSIEIPIKGKTQSNAIFKEKKVTPFYIHHKKEAFFEQNGVAIQFPKNTFYDDFYLDFKTENNIATIHKSIVPLHKSYTLSFNTSTYTDSIKEKMYIANIVNKKYYNYCNTQKMDSVFKTRTKNLGDFTLKTDFEKPVISNCSFYKDQDITNHKRITIKVVDKLCGLKSFRGEIDGKWILMEYNVKTKKLSYDLNLKKLEKGRHKFTLSAKDNVNNTNQYTSFFYIK